MGWSLGLLADDTVSAMIISIAHSVYNVLQKQVVSFKESKSSQIDEDDEQDPVAEALVFHCIEWGDLFCTRPSKLV